MLHEYTFQPYHSQAFWTRNEDTGSPNVDLGVPFFVQGAALPQFRSHRFINMYLKYFLVATIGENSLYTKRRQLE